MIATSFKTSEGLSSSSLEEILTACTFIDAEWQQLTKVLSHLSALSYIVLGQLRYTSLNPRT